MQGSTQARAQVLGLIRARLQEVLGPTGARAQEVLGLTRARLQEVLGLTRARSSTGSLPRALVPPRRPVAPVAPVAVSNQTALRREMSEQAGEGAQGE